MNKPFKKGITFGSFDCLHEGHIRLLRAASEQCETLIVGLSSDAYMRQIKGAVPIFPYWIRQIVVSHLPMVDKVYSQDDKSSKRLLVVHVRADAIFVGSDWTPDTFTGEGLGVPVIYLPHTDGISSSHIRKLLYEA